MAYPLDESLAHLINLVPSWRRVDPDVAAHVRDYSDLTAAADSLIRDDSIQFIFLHFPIPHPPGIYDRRRKVLTAGGDYLDNLALSDRTLLQIRKEIQQTTDARNTILIVSSDHSWRVDMWKPEKAWTREEQRASGGRYDARPFLLIHFPVGSRREERPKPFPELDIHEMIEQMLKGKIADQDDFDSWLSKPAVTRTEGQ